MLNRLAPFFFVLLWSSSFVGTRAGLRDLSPLAFVALRQTISALVLLFALAAGGRGFGTLAPRMIVHLAISGALVNGVLLLSAHWGMVRVEAAPMALVQSLHPLMTALLAGPLLKEWLRPRQWVGLGLGLAGVGLVCGLTAMQSHARLDGLLAGFAGVVALTAGTLWFGRFCRGVPLLEAAAVQFSAAALLSAAAAFTLETARLDWTPTSITAMVWNAGVVGMGGMALYFYMLKHGTAARAAANFYMVPGATAVLVWAVLGERLPPMSLLGLIVASAGCWLVRPARRLPAA